MMMGGGEGMRVSGPLRRCCGGRVSLILDELLQFLERGTGMAGNRTAPEFHGHGERRSFDEAYNHDAQHMI
jgi:hypothetical protein